MKIKQFLKEKSLAIVSILIFLTAVYLLGYAFKIQDEYVVSLTVVLMVLVITNLVVEYMKKKAFYNDFLDKLEELDQKYLITEMIQTPEFLEGEILCDSLYEIDKSMKERINYMEVSQKDFKEYVELWIHEIKVPISTLSCMNYNEYQKEATASFSGRRTELAKQKQQIDKLNYYVEQILFLARADNPQKDYLMKQVSLEQVVNQVIRSNKELIRGNGIRIEKEQLNVLVTSDAKWLEFMIGQIVNNSVKYSVCGMQQDGIIEFEVFEYKDRSELVITDYGIGICREDLPRVFEKTFTGVNGRKVTGSTGMGLYICQKLCQKLGHKLWIESEEGKYTKVHLEFGKEEYYKLEE